MSGLPALMLACAVAAGAAEVPGPAAAAPPEVKVADKYLFAGQKAHGVAVFSIPAGFPKDGLVRITLVRETNVPDDPKAQANTGVEELVGRPVGDQAGTVEVPFDFGAAGMLEGQLRIKAELLESKTGQAPAAAWAPAIKVGVRQRVNLAGEWSVTNVDLFKYENQWRPKDWKMPENVKTVVLPGAFDGALTEWFRGWVTVKREIALKCADGRQPRLMYLSGVSDSALVQVNGETAGETFPLDDIAVLTKWVEFHSPYKGDENKKKRMMFLDIGVQPPSTLVLPKALPAEGKAEIQMTIRGSSGLFSQKPPYGILGELYLAATPPVYVKSVTMDTEKPGPQRRFKFRLAMGNESGKEFKGKLRAVYGRYTGKLAYTGSCPAYAQDEQPISVPQGGGVIEVVRDETPRFDTCHATFVVLDGANVLDAEGVDFHTVTVEIRNRRDLYLNNERFFVKGQGSWGEDANSRLQLRLKGGNAFRSHRSDPSRLYPGMMSAADNINSRLADGLLTSAGGALLASCEKCSFWNPQDTSNITKAVQFHVRLLQACPGLIQWEATNELYGESEECRVAIQEAFHKFDPYHRPMCATKGSGEWEAEAKDGRVAGVDVVGCQYLLSVEALNSVTAAITEHPLMSTEVNWNDQALLGKNLWKAWLDKGVCGSLLFDYSGGALDQPVPMVPPADQDQNPPGVIIRQRDRELYQDVVARAERLTDGRVRLSVSNQMPYALRQVALSVKEAARFDLGDLGPGDAATVLLPTEQSPPLKATVVLRAEYQTHGGLPHLVVLTPTVTAPVTEGGKK
ncbi:MAG: hypothetical protein NTW87_27410 [Planctomycetota bacterium]|nr:hypothetical protein [Planctomycetota bacterium]